MTFILLGGTILRRENIQRVEVIEQVREGGIYAPDHIQYHLRVHIYNANNQSDAITVGMYRTREDAANELARSFEISLPGNPPHRVYSNPIAAPAAWPQPSYHPSNVAFQYDSEPASAETELAVDTDSTDQIRMVRASRVNRYSGTGVNPVGSLQQGHGNGLTNGPQHD